MVRNVHQRHIDGRLEPGSRGGHGPIRYEVARHEPGRLLEFRFPPTFGLRGVHRFEIEPNGDGTVLRHVSKAERMAARACSGPS